MQIVVVSFAQALRLVFTTTPILLNRILFVVLKPQKDYTDKNSRAASLSRNSVPDMLDNPGDTLSVNSIQLHFFI